MPFNIVVSNDFAKDAFTLAKKYRSLNTDLRELMNQLRENPTLGTPLGNSCYKIRMAITSKGKGKVAVRESLLA